MLLCVSIFKNTAVFIQTIKNGYWLKVFDFFLRLFAQIRDYSNVFKITPCARTFTQITCLEETWSK